MDWFDILKEIDMDERFLEAEENCCANIWKSIAQEQRAVFDFLQTTSLWTLRQTTDGCRRLVEWLREGAGSQIDTTRWKFEESQRWFSNSEWIEMMENGIYNQKKGWLQDYVDCYNLKNKTNRPQLEMY